MKRYIEFGYDKNHSPRTNGNPVHNGKIPGKYLPIEGVRISGEIVEFAEPDMHERIGRALRATRVIQRKGQIVDCLWFAVLMDDINKTERLSTGNFRVEDSTSEEHVVPEDTTQTNIVNIGRGLHDIPYHFVHTAYPAHTKERALYIHKLGDVGPLCLSGLQDAIDIFSASAAHPMISYDLVQEQA